MLENPDNSDQIYEGKKWLSKFIFVEFIQWISVFIMKMHCTMKPLGWYDLVIGI